MQEVPNDTTEAVSPWLTAPRLLVLLSSVWFLFLFILFTLGRYYSLVSLVWFIITITIMLTCASAYACYSIAFNMLVWCLLKMSYIIGVSLSLINQIPLVRRVVNTFVRQCFILWFYILVLVEKHLRWISKLVVGSHKETGMPFSFANCMDTRFTGFQMDLSIRNKEITPINARSMAIAAKLAYEKTQVIECEARNWGFDRVKVVKYFNTKAYVATNSKDNVLLVTFCGTHPLNLRNILTDLQATLVDTDFGNVHSGILHAMGIKPLMVEEEEEEEEDDVVESRIAESIVDNAQKKTLKESQKKNSNKWKRTSNRFQNWLLSFQSIRYLSYLFVKLQLKCKSFLLHALGLHEYHEKLSASRSNAPAYDQVCNILTAELKRFESESGSNALRKRTIYVVGHSLGGGLANLFVSKLMVHRPEFGQSIAGVYTFGQPKVGDETFAKIVKDSPDLSRRYYRFVNDNDIIPRLPFPAPSWLAKRLKTPEHHSLLCFVVGVSHKRTCYVHTGRLMYIDPTGRVIESVKLHQIVYMQLVGLLRMKIIKHLHRETWLRIFFRMVLPFFLNDHMITDYIHMLGGHDVVKRI